MPTPANRPFFSNFLTAFRAHQSVHHAVKSASSTALTCATSQTSTVHGATTLSTSTSNSASTASQTSRTITTKASQVQQASTSPSGPNGTTTMALSPGPHFQPHRHHNASPYSRSPGTVSPVGSPGFPLGTPAPSRGRRASDSSNEGFKDALGAGENWYIGGRTAAGEEKFYKLTMVKRPRSVDRLSLDRMSL
jgi:hypothetical protein